MADVFVAEISSADTRASRSQEADAVVKNAFAGADPAQDVGRIADLPLDFVNRGLVVVPGSSNETVVHAEAELEAQEAIEFAQLPLQVVSTFDAILVGAASFDEARVFLRPFSPISGPLGLRRKRCRG